MGKAKIRVYAELCCMPGEVVRSFRSKPKMGRPSGRIKISAWFVELLGIDGEPIEFEWNILPGCTSNEILQKIQNNLRARNIEPEKFTDRIIFMSMLSDIDWTKQGNDAICISKSEKSRHTWRDSRRDVGRSSVVETKRNGVEL